MNIRSIPKNLDTFSATLSSANMNIDILGFTETWLSPATADCYKISGYTHEYITRPEQKGGGVSMFVNENWRYKIRHDIN